MAARDYKGAAVRAVLASDITSTSTSITLAASPGATGWPDGAGGEFYVTIDRDTGSGTHSEESILVLSRTGLTLTLASSAKRGQNDTTAASHTAGVYVEHTASKADFQEANAFVNNPAAVGTITSSAVGDAKSAGVSGTWARGDHKHGREAAPAAFILTHSTTQSITASATPQALTFDTEVSDPSNGHSTVTNPSRYTIPAGFDGTWFFSATAGFASNATGYRIVTVYQNGSATTLRSVRTIVAATNSEVVNIAGLLSVNAGDYLQVFVEQSSGGALNADVNPRFTGNFLRA
jgi:hypothetical protein